MSRTPKTELGVLFGRALRARRLNMNMTQVELARRIGAGKTLINDLENRPRGGVSLSMIDRVAAALECRASDMMRDAEQLRFRVAPTWDEKGNVIESEAAE